MTTAMPRMAPEKFRACINACYACAEACNAWERADSRDLPRLRRGLRGLRRRMREAHADGALPPVRRGLPSLRRRVPAHGCLTVSVVAGRSSHAAAVARLDQRLRSAQRAVGLPVRRR